MKSIFSFKDTKSFPQAGLFYVVYLILFLILIYFIKMTAFASFAFVINAVFGIALTIYALRERKIATAATYGVSIISGAVLFYFSPILGLLVPAYISTVSPTRNIKQRLSERFIPMHNKIFRRKIKHPIVVNFPEAAEVFKQQDSLATDISDHLANLFFESLKQKPKLIVELGVRTGESTKCLERAAKICDSWLIQVDPDAESYKSVWKKSFFVAEDDIKFAKEFKKFCEDKKIPSDIDLLFVDTTHLYDQTLAEIREWFPLLAPSAKVIFHDTAMAFLSKRKDGTFNQGWENDRGVIGPIEKFLGIQVDEKKDFVAMADRWFVTHYSNCSGFTVLERLG